MEGGDRGPLILFFNAWYGGDPPADSMGSLRWTRDKTLWPQADIVVFHMPSIRPSMLRGLPKYRGQIWASWTIESDVHYPLRTDPDIARLFDVTIGFEPQAAVRTTYVPSIATWQEALARPVPAKTEPAPTIMFQSAPFDRSGRNSYALGLLISTRVDSCGRYLQNRRLDGDDRSEKFKLATIGRYRFCIAFENARQPDYVTEKLFQPLLAGTVPVYLGAPNVADYAPPGSFINVEDFSGPRALAAYLDHLAATPGEYARYFDWRGKPLPEPVLALAREASDPVFVRVRDYVAAHFPPFEGGRGRPARPFGLWPYLRVKRRQRKAERSVTAPGA